MADEACILAVSADFLRVEAGLVDFAGTLVHVESAPLRILTKGGCDYIDPAGLLETTFGVVRAVLERKPREARRIAGVSFIGRSPSATAVTAKGPQTPFVLPNGESAAAAQREQIPWREVYDAVGLTARRCEVPFAIAASGAPRGATFLTPKDYLKWAFTGRLSTDPLDAQRTFLWDLSKRAWSDDLCRVFGIEARQLLPVLAPTEVAGVVSADAARATGLKEGLPVACGMGDWGEYLGTGAFDVGDAFEHIGLSGAFYGIVSSRPRRELGLEVRPHVVDGRYLAGREGLAGGTCLEWLLKKTYLARGGEIDWRAVDDELEAIAAMGRPENVLFFPSLAGDSGQINAAAFLNLHIEDSVTSLIQGLTEGLFFSLKAVAEEVKQIPWALKAVYTTGQVGWKHAPRRTRANIYGARIYAGRRPGANVIASALVGAVACGAYRSVEEARSRMLNTDGGVGPVEEVRRLYEGHFVQWLGTRDFLTSGRG